MKNVVFLFVLFLASVSICSAKVVDKAIAVVNGEAIMQSEFEKNAQPMIEQYAKSAPPAEQSPAKIEEFKSKLLDQMIDEKLLKQQATKAKIKVTKRDIANGLDTVKKRFATEAEYQSELKNNGLTNTQFEKRIEEQLMVMKLIENEVKANIPKPSDLEAKALYDKVQLNLAEANKAPSGDANYDALVNVFARLSSEQVRARHILIKVDKNASTSMKTDALNKAKKIRKEALLKDADFSVLAEKYSDDTGSKQRGGDLGYFAKGDMVPEFEKAAFSQNVGTVSEPILTSFGYHIIKVDEKKASKKMSFEETKNDLLDYIYRSNAEKKYETWLENLRSKASIKKN
ncbi:MAG: peptidylprolyl isomerase [Endomicrobiales bacterium]|nr:peptidylprolyl isomerase [Endomicrobiales bacterium]